jgi:carbamoylphosphate synthase small subunit
MAILALEDGRIFQGRAFGAQGVICGEVVFNTGMTGYQEILTDPSYAGQIVCLTYPHIGNYGVNAEDVESSRPWVSGLSCESSRADSLTGAAKRAWISISKSTILLGCARWTRAR